MKQGQSVLDKSHAPIPLSTGGRSRLFILWGSCILAVLLAVATPTSAQPNRPNRVPLTFDRYYNYDEMVEAMKALALAYPDLLTLESIGTSTQGRDLWMMTINNPKTGTDRDKPAMYIDSNIHGNEVQCTEVCLYTIWYLTKSYGHVEKITKLLDERAFYILPSVNPDGRAHWFDELNTSNSSRTGQKPTDNDRDGALDEDGYDDLDGDGYVTTMWKKDPNGRFRRSNKDPRIFERVARDERGDYSNLGSEGIDNDGDGQINEDGPGGYDMNRNWPSDWQPEHIQFGAGDYPLCYPEPAAIAAFILDHPNIAGVQAYHNAGGMILRGPGHQDRERYYPRSDVAVYDEIGKLGEKMLPYYKYMIIWKDLYVVRGGFVNWTAEGLGIFSFTNELWNNEQFYYGKEGDLERSEQRLKFGDLLQFGELFVPLKPFDHPTYGEVLIGGWNKYASRVPPVFMMEELCHRNFAFTMYHAEQMPRLRVSRTRVRSLGADHWELTAEIANEGAIPTISGIAAQKNVGARDRVTLTAAAGGAVEVLASGTVNGWHDTAMTLTRRDPARIWSDRGVAGHGQRIYRWLVQGNGSVEIEYVSQKGGRLRQAVELVESAPPGSDSH